jgi:hypothetical protein
MQYRPECPLQKTVRGIPDRQKLDKYRGLQGKKQHQLIDTIR